MNHRRGIAALLSIKDETAFHVFDCNDLTVVKKAKWNPKHQGKYSKPY